MQKLFLFMTLLLLGTAYAGTVTLTGTCTQKSGQSTLAFGLLNSGNDTALDVVITPNTRSGQKMSEYAVNSIQPQHSVSIDVQLPPNLENGSYVDYFTVVYGQSDSVFSTVFPCVVNIGESTSGNVLLNYTVSYSGKTDTVNVSAYNKGATGITDNISMILPPSFTYLSPTYAMISISPFGYGNASFKIENNVFGSYSGAVVSEYLAGNASHATMKEIVLVAQVAHGSMDIYDIFYTGAITLIAVMLVLILRAFAIRKNQLEKNRNSSS